MKKLIYAFLFSAVLFCCTGTSAHANIAPLKITPDGVEPIENPDISISSANITVNPDDNGFNFKCTYVLKGLQDGGDITIGVPGDPGYTLEAGFIENMNVSVNGAPVEYKVYETTKHLSDTWKNYNSPLNFKWHTFQIPVKKDGMVKIDLTYHILWRVFEQNKDCPYYIIPFIMSSDKLFGNNIDKYVITYMNVENLSIPDVKVSTNFMLDSNIISRTILSPKWKDSNIIWEFKSVKDFQDFRLIVFPYRKLAMGFNSNTAYDKEIRWAMLNNDYEKLASIFESIANGEINPNLDSNTMGTAAYLASEFYFRQKNYDKALEMLSISHKTNLWPVNIKYEYITSLKYKKENNYTQLLDELKKLEQYKEYILVTNYASKEMEPASKMVTAQTEEAKKAEKIKAAENDKTKSIAKLSYFLVPVIVVLSAALIYTLLKRSRNR